MRPVHPPLKAGTMAGTQSNGESKNDSFVHENCVLTAIVVLTSSGFFAVDDFDQFPIFLKKGTWHEFSGVAYREKVVR
jgi:hypothetical protein